MLKQQILSYVINALTLLAVSIASVVFVRKRKAISLVKHEATKVNKKSEKDTMNLPSLDENLPFLDEDGLKERNTVEDSVLNRTLLSEIFGVFLVLSLGLSLIEYIQRW